MTSKDALRAKLLGAARALSAPEREESSRRIQERLLALPAFVAARVVALYAPLASEPELALLFARARAAGKTTVFPGYAGDGGPELREAVDPAELCAGAYRFLHPPPGPRVAAATVDLFVVPGVAFDRRGNRLGRGQGYYDRLLASAAPEAVRVGVCFDHALVDRLEPEPHDAAVDYVVTPSALWAAPGQHR